MKRAICVHGHFYQPPRENPWLEAIERQQSARPYHDWNERITDECYGTNAASRILDDDDNIVEIVNNYAKMSFDFGPTLLTWLADHHRRVYEAIVQADRDSIDRFGGHGSALAQAYNHIIMPLAAARDRHTQIRWGIADFEHRFGRRPDGMWLPETAVDIDTLEALANQGIQFTVLAPNQADAIRPLDGPDDWVDVSDASIDPKRAYRQQLPSGRSIALFFYDGPISRGVAFDDLLRHGERLAERLREAFDPDADEAQLVHVATDGETYGHHHRHGDMALAVALSQLDDDDTVELTNYAAFLQANPPRWEVRIAENTSWSCAHGVGRWQRDCGCHTGGQPSWTQAWRAPLRDGLDWLRRQIGPLYERAAARLFGDPWEARNDYIGVINDRSSSRVDRFLANHRRRPLSQSERIQGLKLLELQRHAMLMFTSCGWFFSDLSGIETIQIIEYAGRVVQLAGELFDRDVRSGFLSRLEKARSNVATVDDGRHIYETRVEPAAIDLRRVGAHYAISLLFDVPQNPARIYAYRVDDDLRKRFAAGDLQLVVGHVHITSEITAEHRRFLYAALHLGGHNVTGGITPHTGPEPIEELIGEAEALFDRAETPNIIRLIDRTFPETTYSLRSLFRDERHRVMQSILAAAIDEAQASYEQVYRRRAPLLRFLADLDIPQPRSFEVAAEIVLNRQIEDVFWADQPDPTRLAPLLEEAATGDVTLDKQTLGYTIHERLVELADHWAADPYDVERLDTLAVVANMADQLPFEINVWEPQNRLYDILQSDYRAQARLADQADQQAARWVDAFCSVAASLNVAVAPV